MALRCILLKCLIFVIVSCDSDTHRGPTVCLKWKDKQCLSGTTQTSLDGTDYEAFFGVPFAKPPIGELRFANPVPNDPWIGTYDASKQNYTCIQRNVILPGLGDVYGSEDCLYLNIYRPKVILEALPVMIFIHGGSFRTGSASPLIEGPDKFMDKKNVILVVVQYRLGALGFLSTGDSVIPGNFGLKDQAMAIRWVKRHIHRFGGNTDLITLFGESAGAASTQLHMMSPLSRGHFSRAILMSGSALAAWANPTVDSLYFARQQMAALGYKNIKTLSSHEILRNLRRFDANVLVKSVDVLEQLVGLADAQTLYRPVIEEFVKNQSFLSDSPIKLWESGNYEQIPWMVGHVPNEGIIFSATAIQLMANAQLWSQIAPRIPIIVTTGTGLDITDAPLLKERFFAESTNADWITPSNVNRFSDLATEGSFKYPTLRAIRSHLKHANYFSAPVSMYYFNFSGPYSMSQYYLPNDPRSFGICHGDDLIYLFNQPAFFPPFPKHSPGWKMSKKLVDFFINFAYYGISETDLNGSCQYYEHCDMVEFYNTDDSRNAVGIKHTRALDTELLAFWYLLHSDK